ncbi:hypothetical protein [Enterococcus sp. CWB-B31]|uniref:hypothetical protein n=1 Tax=Enterococcus sp. CWB-B31 TaxID=2885159 RepID=UPI001E4813B2|nr:hypothetical protein [Enterococcus sp. CWB-B31]MCB5955125.1 hypothetical protein [Enterococcus sp. CWB-B31]
MDFHKLKEELTEKVPHSFLALASAEQEQSDDDPFFVFQMNIEEIFETSINFLSSEETLSMEEVNDWKEADFLVVCQTIDGDFIGGNKEETFVIPQSLYKTDIEIYPYFLSDFFIAYEDGTIESPTLPPV